MTRAGAAELDGLAGEGYDLGRPGLIVRPPIVTRPEVRISFRYQANGQECPDWFKIPQDLDPASARWQMFLLGPGATIHA
jgi:hypothetical protein